MDISKIGVRFVKLKRNFPRKYWYNPTLYCPKLRRDSLMMKLSGVKIKPRQPNIVNQTNKIQTSN